MHWLKPSGGSRCDCASVVVRECCLQGTCNLSILWAASNLDRRVLDAANISGEMYLQMQRDEMGGEIREKQ